MPRRSPALPRAGTPSSSGPGSSLAPITRSRPGNKSASQTIVPPPILRNKTRTRPFRIAPFPDSSRRTPRGRRHTPGSGRRRGGDTSVSARDIQVLFRRGVLSRVTVKIPRLGRPGSGLLSTRPPTAPPATERTAVPAGASRRIPGFEPCRFGRRNLRSWAALPAVRFPRSVRVRRPSHGPPRAERSSDQSSRSTR